MMVDITYTAGTQKSPQQTKLSKGCFSQTDRVRFDFGRLTNIPQWQDVTPSNMSFLGGARSVFGTSLTDTNVGDFFMVGTNLRTYAMKSGTLYNMTPLQTSGVTLGTDPLNITNGDNTVIVTHATHGKITGDRISMSGIAGALNGVPAADFNKEHIITYIDANSYSIEVATAPTSSDSTAGGAAVVVKAQISGGYLNQQPAEGFSAGDFGGGLFGQGEASATAQTYPRIHSFDVFGNDMVFTHGDYAAGDGQNIYIWDGDTAVAPTILTGAPTDCNFVLVVANAVVALCKNRIDISGIGSAINWTVGSGSTAYTKTLERVGRIISGIRVSDKAAILFSDRESFLLQYVGEPDYWDISDLSQDDGIISPHACVNMHGVVYWMGWRGWYQYAGGYPVKLPNDLNENWWFSNLNYAQAHKCFAMPDTQNSEVYFFAPMEGSNEPSQYNIMNVQGDIHWTLGNLDRTAAMRGGFVGGQFLAVNGTSESVSGEVYRCFVDNPALTMGCVAETADAILGDGSKRMKIQDFMPDGNQDGDITVTYITKEWPQHSTETISTAYTVTSTTKHQTVKAAGRTRRIRFASDAPFTLGAWKETIQQQGKRA